MKEFEAKPKKWGNSLGITIPKEIAEEEGIKAGKKVRVFVVAERKNTLKEMFGSLKGWKKPTQKIMKEIDEGYD